MTRKTLIPLLGLAALCLFSFLNPAAAEESAETITVVSLGNSAISGDNVTRAKDRAVADALYLAVEKAVTTLLTRTDVAQNLDGIYETVLENAQGFVKSYRVLGESRTDGTYRVAVEAVISAGVLESAFASFGLTGAGRENPKVLLFISEQVPGEILPRYWWGNNPLPYTSMAEQAIAQFFLARNYELPGYGSDRPVPADSGIVFEYIHDARACLMLAAELRADMVVLGRAVVKEMPGGYRANVSLELFEAQKGEQLTVVETEASIEDSVRETGIERALNQAGTEAAEKLSAVISRHWAEAGAVAQTIETKILGDDYLSSFIMLRKLLSNMQGIEDIQTREIGSSQAFLDIVYRGTPRKFADALLLNTFDTFDIEISEVTETSLTIRFITKGSHSAIDPKEIEGAYISE